MIDLSLTKKNSITEYLENFVWDLKRFFRRCERFIAYRTYDRYNIIKIRSLPPNYYETDSLILYGMFELLVDFVEVELASRQQGGEEYKKGQSGSLTSKIKYIMTPNFLIYKRSRKHGLEYIDFYRSFKSEFEEETLMEDSTKKFGDELYELYTWWTDKRPNRGDAWELGGLDKFHETHKSIHYMVPIEGTNLLEMKSRLNEEEEKEYHSLIDKMGQIEIDQNNEDEEMLIRLVKIRKSLWT